MDHTRYNNQKVQNIDYIAVFREAPKALVIIDENEVVKDATNKYIEVVNQKREVLIGENLFKFFPESEDSLKQKFIRESIKKVFVTGKSDELSTFRYDIMNKENKLEPKFWKTKTLPIQFSILNKPEYVLHELTDVTEEVLSNESMVLESRGSMFKMILDNVQDYAIFMLDRNGIVCTWSSAAKRIKQYDASEILGKHFSKFYTDEDLKAGKPSKELEIAEKEDRIEDEGWRKRKDGSLFWANVIITAMYTKENEFIGFAKITRDLTERKRAEENIILAYEEASRLKNEFLSNMSHEMRTPMHGMISALKLLDKSVVKPDDVELIEIIEKSADDMLKLVDMILEYAKLKADDLEIISTEFSLKTLVDNILLNYNNVKPSVKLGSSFDEKLPSLVVGDKIRLQQVLEILIENAIKFTNEGEVQINVSIEKMNIKDLSVKFCVIDTGIGISKENIQKLFQPFVQFDKFSTKRYKGAGLGLALCKKLLSIMKGTLTVESVVNKGSTFCFVVPLNWVNQESSAIMKIDEKNSISINSEESGNSEGNKKISILVVEDNKINRKVIVRTLTKLGFTNIDTAEDGKESITKFQQNHYDIVLMDIQMPLMDGYQATRIIRNMLFNNNVPILALTANALSDDRQKCLDAGMDDYMAKPVDINVLYDKIKYWLNKRNSNNS